MNKKTLLVAIGAAVFGFASSALAAGQGGIAGAASFLLPGGVVSSAAAAVAVGKSTGYANANTMTAGTAEAQAAGAAGVLALDTATAYITSIAAEDVTTLPIPQLNAITATSTNIDASNATIDQVQ